LMSSLNSKRIPTLSPASPLSRILRNISTPVIVEVNFQLPYQWFQLISCISNPVSIRPVATVPRPVIENTSSTGIKKGFATSLIGFDPKHQQPKFKNFWYPSWIIIQSTLKQILE
jgi:hypothetical protein